MKEICSVGSGTNWKLVIITLRKEKQISVKKLGHLTFSFCISRYRVRSDVVQNGGSPANVS